MSRCRYFEGVSSEVPRARPMRSRVRCQPGTGWALQRRMDSSWMPSPAAVARRPRCRTGHNLSSAIEARTVTPATMTNVRTMTVIGFMAPSHLDLRDAPDHEEADHFHDYSSEDQGWPDGVVEERIEKAGMQDLEHQAEDQRAESDQDSRPAMLRCEHSCIAQNLEALANDFGQPIEDLRQVAAGSSLDPDRGAEEANVLGYDPTLQPEQSVSRVHAQPDLLIDLPKLLSHRIRHFLSNEPNGSAQGISGSNGPRDHVEGVRKLRLEALHTTAPLVYEVDDRDAARNEAGEDAPEKSARPKPRCSAADGSTRHHDERDVCDGGPVARLGRQGGQAVRQPGPAEQLFNGSIALFDLGPEDLRRADRRSPRETGAEVTAHLGDPPSPGNQDDDEQEYENCYCRGHRRTACRLAGSKTSEPRWMPARDSRSVNFGRTPVALWKPTTPPSESIPSWSKVKMSGVVTTSSSTPTISVTRTIFRVPSDSRDTWMTRSSADAT